MGEVDESGSASPRWYDHCWFLPAGGDAPFKYDHLGGIAPFKTLPLQIKPNGPVRIPPLHNYFQPELRKALEQLGSKNIITDLFISENSRQQEGYTEKTVNEITRAAFEMGKVKTGALIVIERDTPLPEIERTGIPVDGIVTSQLLINIFEHNTPLHDGAIIIRGNRVTSATCYLPLSDNLSISKDLGTRHRAALGISESTDSLTVVVSEETGRVSLAEGGSLRRINSPEELKLAIAAKPEEETVSGPFKLLKGWHKNERKAE